MAVRNWKFYWSRDIIGQVSPFTRSSVTVRIVHWLRRVKSFVVWTGSPAMKFIRCQIISWFVNETCLNVVNSIRHSHCSVAACPFEAWNPITHYLKIHIFAVYCEIRTKNTNTHAYISCVCACVCEHFVCTKCKDFQYKSSRTKWPFALWKLIMLQQYISPETDVILPRWSPKQPSTSIFLSGVVNSANILT